MVEDQNKFTDQVSEGSLQKGNHSSSILLMGSKPPDPAPAPNNTVSIKRGRFDTSNSPTMVYVRRKIDHDQQNKPSSSETPKTGGIENTKEPNMAIIEENKEPDLECHESSLEAALNELKGVAPNLVENKENDSILDPKGEQIGSQQDSELCEMKVGESTVSPGDVATEPKLDSKVHESEALAPTEVTYGEKESNLSPNEDKNEPDLVCHETNFDADLVELKVTVADQLASIGVNEKEIEDYLDGELQQQKIFLQNQVTNGDKDQNLGKNELKLGSIRSKQCVTDANSRSNDRENCRERFAKLQLYLKDCDRSMQDDYVKMLRSLSAEGRSKHAAELEQRAMDLLMEEGKELRRMNNLHVLGKDWLKDILRFPARTNFRRQL